MAASLHGYICMIEWFGCVGCFIWGCTDGTPFAQLWWVALLTILLIPLLNELILNLKGCLCKSRVLTPTYSERYQLKDCLPIVYSPDYNIHAFGIEKCHPFDSTKYKRVFDDLVESGTVS